MITGDIIVLRPAAQNVAPGVSLPAGPAGAPGRDGASGPAGLPGPAGTTSVAGLADATAPFKALNAPDAASQRAAMGAQPTTYAQAGTGAINALVADKLKGIYVLAEEYGTVGQGDDTTAINAALATGRRLLLLERTYPVSNVVVPIGSQGIAGFGDKSVLMGGVGGDATGNIVTYSGNGNTDRAWGAVFDNFKISTSVNRTGGHAFLLNITSNISMRNVRVGDLHDLYTGAANGKFLYNGVTWIDFYHARMTSCDMAGFNNDGVTLAGVVIGSGEFTWDGDAEVVQATRAAFHCAGNAGGVKLLSGGGVLSRIGFLASNELSSTVNQQIFIQSQFNLDTNLDYGVLLEGGSFYYFQADTLWCRGIGKNAQGQAVAGAIGSGITVAPGQRTDALVQIAQLTTNENTGTGATFNSGNIQIGGGSSSFNGGNGIAVTADVQTYGCGKVFTEYNTAYGQYIDPALVSSAKSSSALVSLTGAVSRGNGAGSSVGYSGASSGLYEITGGIGIPTS